MPKNKDLILGVIANYTLDEIRPFFHTLRSAGYQGDVVMMVRNVDDSTQRAMQIEYGVRVVPFVETYPYVQGFESEIPYHDQKYSLCVQRFFAYQAWFAHQAETYDRILLTDVRDVVFQADPFDLMEPGLHVFAEENIIAENSLNRKWLQAITEPAEYDIIQHNRVLCAGTILGDAQSVVRYVNYAAEKLSQYPSEKGEDQAMLNYLVYLHKIPAKIWHNQDGYVLTVASGLGDWHIERGDVIAPSGKRFAIIHQYDRVPRLRKLFVGRKQRLWLVVRQGYGHLQKFPALFRFMQFLRGKSS